MTITRKPGYLILAVAGLYLHELDQPIVSPHVYQVTDHNGTVLDEGTRQAITRRFPHLAKTA